MKKQLFLISSLSLALFACETASPNADNTARNKRDVNSNTVTSGDQSEAGTDRVISQKIRQLIVGDDSLSTDAKNVKVITMNGKVTLRGPVNSDRERMQIENKAKQVNGVVSVANQLEVINQNQGGYRE